MPDGMTKQEAERLARVEENQNHIIDKQDAMKNVVDEIHRALHNGLMKEVKLNTEYREHQMKDRDRWKWGIRLAIIALGGRALFLMLEFVWNHIDTLF